MFVFAVGNINEDSSSRTRNRRPRSRLPGGVGRMTSNISESGLRILCEPLKSLFKIAHRRDSVQCRKPCERSGQRKRALPIIDYILSILVETKER